MAYELKKSIDAAWFELDKMEQPTLTAVLLLSKKYSPKTFSDVADVFKEEEDFRLIMPMRAESGRLVIDVISATVGELIYDQLLSRLQAKAQEIMDKQKRTAIQAEYNRVTSHGDKKKKVETDESGN